VEAVANLPNIAVPLLEARRRGRSPNLRYFGPLDLDEQVKVTPLLTPDNYFDAAISLVKSAKEEILLQNQTFNAPAEHQEKLTELVGLIQEKQKRISVRIVFRVLMESDARKNLEALVDMGFDPDSLRVQTNLHTKGIIVDGKKVLLGSQNISETGISINRDASLLFEHEGIATYFKDIFEHDWGNLAQKDIGGSFQPAWSTGEAALLGPEAATSVLLSPKDYLPLL
jgi:phosphatidylserine/phosphatidylglycerophosphate/cardiolipin synthase-like enzyme